MEDAFGTHCPPLALPGKAKASSAIFSLHFEAMGLGKKSLIGN